MGKNSVKEMLVFYLVQKKHEIMRGISFFLRNGICMAYVHFCQI